MNEIKIIKKSTFLGKEIDVYGTAEEPLFKAKDVAEWIEHTNPSKMISDANLDESEFTTITLSTLTNSYSALMLTEGGLYEVLMQSRKPIAKQFKKGVKEILKSIRKTGGYLATTENDTPATILARAMKVADKVIAEHEQRIKQLEEHGREQDAAIERKDTQIKLQTEQIKKAAPKVEYYDTTLASVNYITATQVADSIGISARALNKKLQEIGIIYYQSEQWHLKAPYKSWNLASTRTHTYINSHDENVSKQTLVWNQRGRRFILALYKNGFNVNHAMAEIKGSTCPISANI